MKPYLFDENIPSFVRTDLRRIIPNLDIWAVGSPGAPPLGAEDSAILVWCEEHDFILVTNNRKSMPVHLAAHLESGRHVPGILTLDLTESTGTIVLELRDIAELSFEDEYQDRIEYIPLQR
jgi:hypothetical protein